MSVLVWRDEFLCFIQTKVGLDLKLLFIIFVQYDKYGDQQLILFKFFLTVVGTELVFSII